jgi:hypothetical protein
MEDAFTRFYLGLFLSHNSLLPCRSLILFACYHGIFDTGSSHDLDASAIQKFSQQC